MRDVSEVSAFRLQLFDIFKSTLQPKVRLMRAYAQTVEHQHSQTAQSVHGGGRYLAEVGRVRKVIESVRNHRQPAVNYFQRRDFQIGAETKLSAVDDRMRNDLRQPAAKMGGLKNILKDAADVFPGALVGIEAEGAITKVQRANVIQAENVISVTMRHQHRIEVPQPNLQGLLSKITRSIDNDGLTGMFDEDRHPQA